MTLQNPEKSGSLSGVDNVGGFFREVHALMDKWKPELEALFSVGSAAPLRKEIDRVVEPLARTLLQGDGYPLAGAGFVAAKNALADAQWHMAWWQGNSKDQLMLSTLETLGEAYARREWFTTPLKSGQRHVTGPYVDFICTDEYTVTLTAPVSVGSRIVGVVGADVFVASLETVLLPALARVHPKAALVNRAGRVVVSADPHVPAGQLLVDWRATGSSSDRPVRGVGSDSDPKRIYGLSELPLAVVVSAA